MHTPYDRSRFRQRSRLLATLTSFTLIGLALTRSAAQTTPAAPPVANTEATDGDASIVLSPFTVNASEDTGWIATNSLAGGRVKTALKDTPVAYSVLTSEFLDSFNLTDMNMAAAFTTNSTADVQDGTYQAFGTTSASTIKLRGTNVTQTRNFFPFTISPDSFDIDRFDFARGPNAVLFGAGGIGGTANSVTKQALPNKTFGNVVLQVGSYDKFRVTADYNQPFADKKGAVRVNLMSQRNETWRQNEWAEKYGVHVAATYEIVPRLTIRVEGEYLHNEGATSNSSLRDRMSAWDGKYTSTGIPVAVGTADPLSALARETAGVTTLVNQRFVTQAGFPAGSLQNYGGTRYTKAARQDGTATSYINGVAVRTVGFNLADTAMVDDNFGIPADRWTAATANSFFVPPSRSATSLWSSRVPTYEETGKDLAAYLNYSIGDFSFEVAADYNTGDRIGNTASRRGLMDVYMDINQSLPDGTANPNFKHPYVEFMEYRNLRSDEVKNIRAQAVYSKDTKYGRLNFSLMGGKDEERGVARAKTLLLPLSSATFGNGSGAVSVNGLDGRTWVDNDEYSLFGVYTRLYLDQANRDYAPLGETPVSVNIPGAGKQTVTPKWMYDTRRVDNNRDTLREYKYWQAAANLDLFKNHLVLIGAFRRDYTTTADYRVILPGDEKPGWDGTTLTFRQPAPDDFFSLMYTPKDANGNQTGVATSAATRPRTRSAATNFANLRQAQYANDRFQDDYDSPVISPTIDTFTVGGVYNIKPWVGIYANLAQTFSLPTPQTKLDGSLFPETSSQGTDYGVRFYLPGGKLMVSLGRYTSYQENASNNIGQTSFRGDYNSIYNVAPVGTTDPFSRNARNVETLPENIYDSLTRDVDGYEMELTANLTPNWRLSVNAGSSTAIQTNVNPDMVAYFASSDQTARAILKDAGILINSTNDASLDPQYVNSPLVNITKVNAAIAGWNHLQDIFIPANTNLPPQQIPNTSKWVGNVSTDYRFQSTFLKGLRVGAALNYRGESVIGFRSADTIVDPNNPTQAIDDPTVGSADPVTVPAYYTMTGTLSYTVKLKKGRSLQFDLFVTNLLDNDDLVYTNQFSGQANTYVRPRTDISSPARVTVPGAFSYIAPRSFTFSTKLTF